MLMCRVLNGTQEKDFIEENSEKHHALSFSKGIIPKPTFSYFNIYFNISLTT
jgi:hypothetical protein